MSAATDVRKSPGRILIAAVREMGITEDVISIDADPTTVTIETYRPNADGHRWFTETGDVATTTHVLDTHLLVLPHECTDRCTNNDPLPGELPSDW